MTKLAKDRHTQAKKAERQSKKHTKHNITLKNKIKKIIKKLNNAINTGNVEEAKKLLPNAIKIFQRSSNKNIIHKNNASRKISQFARKINKMKPR